MDNLLSTTSNEIFSHLECGQKRIIEILAKSEPLNLTEIGELTSKFTIGFDRWGVKDRIYGSDKFHGLIFMDYVYKFKINKKETKYGLTIKGLLAALRTVKFNQLYLIKRYEQFLNNYTNKQDLIQRILLYIKSEIAYLLYCNYIQGINWTKFRFLKSYLQQIGKEREYPNNYLDIRMERNMLLSTQKKIFQSLLQTYSKNHKNTCFIIGYVDPLNAWNKLMINQKNNPKITAKFLEIIGLTVFVSQWYKYIDSFILKKKVPDLVNEYLAINGVDPYELVVQSVLGKKAIKQIMNEKNLLG